jgi:hypothetical protein
LMNRSLVNGSNESVKVNSKKCGNESVDPWKKTQP